MALKKTILLLTDFSKRAARAAEMALELAVNNQADLLVYNSVIKLESDLITSAKSYAEPDMTGKTERSKQLLIEITDRLRLKLPEQATTGITYQQGTGGVIATIQRLVKEQNIWMVIMGAASAEKPINQLIPGNIPSVLSYCSCPLLLIP